MESTLPQGTRIILDEAQRPRRFDIVAYNVPAQYGDSPWVHRLIAMPGDSIAIIEGNVFVNNQKIPESDGVQHLFLVETKFIVMDDFFEAAGISANNVVVVDESKYFIHLTSAKAEVLRSRDPVLSVERFKDSREKAGYLFEDYQEWNKDNFGYLYIPRTRDIVRGETMLRYAKIILDYEGVDIEGLPEYQFRKNYYFMMGDNRDNTLDSRYHGIIPESEVLGVVSVNDIF